MNAESDAYGSALRALYDEAQQLIDSGANDPTLAKRESKDIYARFAELRAEIAAYLRTPLPEWTAPERKGGPLELDDLLLLQQGIYEASEALDLHRPSS